MIKRNVSQDASDKTKTVQRFTKSMHKTNSNDKPLKKGTRLGPASRSQHENTKRGEAYDSLMESGRSRNEALDESQMDQNKCSR